MRNDDSRFKSLLDVEVSIWRTLLDYPELCCKLQYNYSKKTALKIMATEKITALTFPVEPNIKEALCTAVDRDHRSLAKMVAVMIREHCAGLGIPIQDKQAATEFFLEKSSIHESFPQKS